MNVILAARAGVAPPAVSTRVPGVQTKTVVDRFRVDLLGVNGDVIPLSMARGNPLDIAADPAPYGFWIGEYDSATEKTPGVDGERYGDVTAQKRPVGLTVNYAFGSVAERRAFASRLANALNPKRGLAGFLVTEPDASARMVIGRFVGSSDQWFVERDRGTWSIELEAADDPYWLDAPGSGLPARTWKAPQPVEYYPYLPTQLAEDSAIGEPIEIDNTGHEDVYPDWLIQGPATSALFANDTTGEQLAWSGVLAEGKFIAIVTKPGMQEVVDSDGNNRFNELDQDPDPALWYLVPGVNVIRTVINGVEADTSITLLELQRRWMMQG